jgi:hypothetical protein
MDVPVFTRNQIKSIVGRLLAEISKSFFSPYLTIGAK